MISYSEAISILSNAADSLAKDALPTVWQPLQDAVGCRLAASVVSEDDFPAFDGSLVDGFALRSAETERATPEHPITMLVLGETMAGEEVSITCPFGATALYISTGAYLPSEFDAIVRIEDVASCERDPNDNPLRIKLTAPVYKGNNVRYKGSDFAKGLRIVERGARLDPRHTLALAALGMRDVPVYQKPRVAIVATGTELDDLTPAAELPRGRVRNATTPFLIATLRRLGCEITHHTAVADDPISFQRLFKEVLPELCDVVITTGGVSLGKRDFIESALREVDAEILFHTVAARPGKPLMAAKVPRPDVSGSPMVALCLPGNPLATVAGTRFFVSPFLRRLCAIEPEKPLLAKLGNTFSKPPGMRTFLLASVKTNGTELEAFVGSAQESYRVLPLARSNAWVVVSEVCKGVQAGDTVEVYPLFETDVFGDA